MNIKKRLIFFFSNSLFKNAYYLAANSIIGSLTGFIFWIIAARLFSTEDIGLASTIISAIGLLALLSNFGFNISLIRFLPELKDKSTTLINSCSLVSVSVAFILSIIFLYGTDFLSPSLSSVKSSGLFAMIFVSFTMLMVLASLHESVFVGFRKVDFSFRKMLIQNIIKIPLIFLFKAFGSLGIISAFGIAYLIATVVSVVILIPRINPNYKLSCDINLKMLKSISSYSAGNYLAWIFESLPNFIFPIIITNTLNAEKAAYFYIAWMIASILFIIPKSLATSLFAEGSHNKNTIKQNSMKSIKTSLVLVAMAMIILFFTADKILLLFGSEYSANSRNLLFILTISALPMIINSIYISIKRIEKDVKTIILVNAFIALGTLTVSYSLITTTGITGIAYGYLITNCFVSLIVIKDIMRGDTISCD